MQRGSTVVLTGLTDEAFFIECREKLRAKNGSQANKIASVDELRMEREDDQGLWTTVLDTEDFTTLILDDGSFEDALIRGVLSEDVAIAEYAASNANVVQSLYSGHAQQRRGQLFELTARSMVAAIAFDLQKRGSPTGPVTVELFASEDETIPTGSALASGTVEASTLATIVGVAPALAFTTVELSSPLIVEPGWYGVSAKFDAGDINNSIDIGFDNTSPTHEGHAVSQNLAGDWSAALTSDRTFQLVGRRIPAPSSRYRFVAECTLENLVTGVETEDVFRAPARVVVSAENPIVAGVS